VNTSGASNADQSSARKTACSFFMSAKTTGHYGPSFGRDQVSNGLLTSICRTTIAPITTMFLSRTFCCTHPEGFSRLSEYWQNPFQKGFASKTACFDGVADEPTPISLRDGTANARRSMAASRLGHEPSKWIKVGQEMDTHVSPAVKLASANTTGSLGLDHPPVRTFGHDWARAPWHVTLSHPLRRRCNSARPRPKRVRQLPCVWAVESASSGATPVVPSRSDTVTMPVSSRTLESHSTPSPLLWDSLRGAYRTGSSLVGTSSSAGSQQAPSGAAKQLPALDFMGVAPAAWIQPAVSDLFQQYGPRGGIRYRLGRKDCYPRRFGLFYQGLGQRWFCCNGRVQWELTPRPPTASVRRSNWDQGGGPPPATFPLLRRWTPHLTIQSAASLIWTETYGKARSSTLDACAIQPRVQELAFEAASLALAVTG